MLMKEVSTIDVFIFYFFVNFCDIWQNDGLFKLYWGRKQAEGYTIVTHLWPPNIFTILSFIFI